MPSALNIITRALGIRKVLGTGQVPTGAEASDGLEALNAMLKTMSGQRLMVYQILQEALTLTAGAASRTIGTGGNLNTARPTRVEDSLLTLSGTDFPVDVISIEDYNTISDKTATGTPRVMAYRPEYPLGILYFYPAPDASAAAASAFKLNSWKQLQQFATLTTDVALPPVYEEMLVYNLARRLSRRGGSLSPEDIAIASESIQTVRADNAAPRSGIRTDIGYINGAFSQGILSG